MSSTESVPSGQPTYKPEMPDANTTIPRRDGPDPVQRPYRLSKRFRRVAMYLNLSGVLKTAQIGAEALVFSGEVAGGTYDM